MPSWAISVFLLVLLALGYQRSNSMKSGTRDETEGKWHRVKGKVKEIVGKLGDHPDLEAEGKKESRTGEVQEKIGEIKKVVGQ